MKSRNDGSRRGIFLSVSMVSAAALMLGVQGMADALLSQPMFVVREVEVVWPDPATAQANPAVFRLHPPTSVFRVDLNSLSQAFRRRFPLSEVERIERVLPNRLRATMKKRRVVAQFLGADKKHYPVSDDGLIVAPGQTAPWASVPLVEFNGTLRSVRAGARLPLPNFWKCAELLTAVRRDGGIAGRKIKRIRIDGPDVHLFLDSGTEIRFSSDEIWTQWQRLTDLAVQKRDVLTQSKYVDLRFEHPVIADNPPVKKAGKKAKKAKTTAKAKKPR